MPKTGYEKCIEIMARLFSHGKQKEASVNDIKNQIRVVAGTDDRTIDKYKTILTDIGFLQQKNSTVYEIQNAPYLYHDHAGIIAEKGKTAVETFNKVMDERLEEMK